MNSPFEAPMREALALAEKGRWHVCPNPTVGAVLVRAGQVVARGWHQTYGGPHAEIACLNDAREKGIDPKGATLVVTLEPCNHQGQTPPCTKAILEAGISQVVVGCVDPNPTASGGLAALRAAGVSVEVGVLESECRELIADFLTWQRLERPHVILKMASTLDGYIATRSGISQHISNERSHNWVAQQREGVGLAGGAVLIGGNTFFVDNPRLTARTGSAHKQPIAAMASSRLPGPDSASILLQERPGDCIFFSSAAQAASPNAADLRARGARIYGLDRAASGRGLDIVQLLHVLYREEKCRYVLCEGGAKLAYSLLEQNLVDEFHLFLAPIILADCDARPLFDGSSCDSLTDAMRLRLLHMENLDGDVHLHFRPRSL